MPLSENEQRLLEQIERGLLADDPKFADKVRSTDPRHRAVRRGALAVALFLAGVAIMVFGLVSKIAPGGVPLLGILGFVVMFGAAVLGVQSYLYTGRGDQRPLHAVGSEPPKGRGRSRGHRSSLLDRLEERWRRRADEDR
ncbi:DUF3040 domain-containing protein [Cryptosporangium phraense]|uniref:DUF3040 domain-containing protein n=1 Tax=Cryptosporangium phraense TaxID=2593070 RepID=A0A545AKB3_9ACTN|nr:DUF3040 domain-containing protein [Cryptosporangium phraense]TQS41711.1 DUF3040 domain-containing protein [Cryptosporangium phraense]